MNDREKLLASEARIAELVGALRELEDANDEVAAGRTQSVYLAMIDAGQQDALLRLDNARLAARALAVEGKDGSFAENANQGSSRSQPVVSSGQTSAEPSGAGTRWLIEETWSGYVHYVHRDFNCVKWATECRRDEERRRIGLMARMRVPVVTKNIEEAMTFQTKDAADLWKALQPRWMSQGDQYQIREHEWVDPTPSPESDKSSGEGSGEGGAS